MWSVFLPVCDAGVWTAGVPPVGPFDWEPPGGSSNLMDNMLLSYTLLSFLWHTMHISAVHLHVSLEQQNSKCANSFHYCPPEAQHLLGHMIRLHTTADTNEWIPRCPHCVGAHTTNLWTFSWLLDNKRGWYPEGFLYKGLGRTLYHGNFTFSVSDCRCCLSSCFLKIQPHILPEADITYIPSNILCNAVNIIKLMFISLD